MALRPAERFAIEEASQVAPARRAAERLAASLGFDAVHTGEAAIVATELATNLLRHAGGGHLVLRPDHGELALLAWDRGPGMGDIGRSMRDGFSTAGGSGTGLGAVGRLADALEVYSPPGMGTVVLARLGAPPGPPPLVDGLALAMGDEDSSGDAWASVSEGAQTTILLADGLGHGVDAARAAAAAIGALRPSLAPEVLLARMHEALRPTRGAAASIARLDRAAGTLRFAGVGNVAASIVEGGVTRSLTCMNGTVGHRIARIQAFDYPFGPDALLVMHSDGTQSGWDLARYPGLARRDPLLVASTLIRDHERGRDDVSVVVARGPEHAAA